MRFLKFFHCLGVIAMVCCVLFNAAAMKGAQAAERSHDCSVEQNDVEHKPSKHASQPSCCPAAHCCPLLPGLHAGAGLVPEADDPVARTVRQDPLILPEALDPPPRSRFG
jgi:hypothetical protein